MHKWLFCFQKSVALVLTHLMRSKENRSPFEAMRTTSQKTLVPSPEKGTPRHHHHEANTSGKWTGAQSFHPNGMLSNEEVSAAFLRHDARSAGGRALDRYDSRHSDGWGAGGVDSPSKLSTGSAAIPIQPTKAVPGAAHGHAQNAHSHHSHHSRSRAHSSNLRTLSHDGYSGATSRNVSVDKVATSYKEEDDEHPRLEDLLQTPSEGSYRTRSHSGSDGEDSDDIHGDWRSRASNEMPDDEEE